MAPRPIEAIVMGASAGGLEALSTILPALPAGFPIPVACVLHMLPGKPSHLVEVLSGRSALAMKEAEDKEPIARATVYFAPPNYHLLIEKQRCFSLSVDDPIHFSRPSIDVLFESAADAYGPALVGVLLTGANEDGAKGIARIKDAGGMTVVQSLETAFVRTMPEAALRATEVDHVLPIGDIGPFLARLDMSRMSKMEQQ
jgi:two-component system chemotaxis response regulator CheB